jgi:insertion element IS1 protein InsB
LTLRTRIKRLARKRSAFRASIWLHDVVIGLFINRYEFGRAVWELVHRSRTLL